MDPLDFEPDNQTLRALLYRSWQRQDQLRKSLEEKNKEIKHLKCQLKNTFQKLQATIVSMDIHVNSDVSVCTFRIRFSKQNEIKQSLC